jgi:TatD DNase family protein
MPLIDSHTHIDQYDALEIPELLERARAAGVGMIIVAGTTVESSRNAVTLSHGHPIVYGGVGLHPADLTGPVDDATADILRELAADPKVVVWSETGLDYLASSPPRELQEQAFRAQIRLAVKAKLPLVVHSREAHPDLLRLLREEHASDVGGIFHYFQGDLATAEAAMDMGFDISMAKPLLRLPELQEVAAKLPLERIVLETDSFPQPFKKYRERWTEPWHLPQVAEKLAELQGISVDEVTAATTANVLRILGGRVSLGDLQR